MNYTIPKTNTPLTIYDFKPGFSFMLKDGLWWHRITIHQNCPDELLAFTVRAFKRNPEEFKRGTPGLVMESAWKQE